MNAVRSIGIREGLLILMLIRCIIVGTELNNAVLSGSVGEMVT